MTRFLAQAQGFNLDKRMRLLFPPGQFQVQEPPDPVPSVFSWLLLEQDSPSGVAQDRNQGAFKKEVVVSCVKCYVEVDEGEDWEEAVKTGSRVVIGDFRRGMGFDISSSKYIQASSYLLE